MPFFLGPFPFYPQLSDYQDANSKKGLDPVLHDLCWMKMFNDKRIGNHHLTPHSPQNRRTKVNDPGIFVHQQGQEVAGKNHKGDTQTQTEQEKKQITLGSPGYGQDIIRGHGNVGDYDHPDGLPEGFGLFVDVFFPRCPFNKKFDRYPENNRPADKFYKLDLKELSGKKGEDHPEDNGGAGPEGNAPHPLLARQGPNRHGNDHGIIPGQDEIN
jgi:hypothetical protein